MKNAELPYVQQVPYFGMKKPNISENMTLQIIEMLLVLAIAVETCTATSRNHLKSSEIHLIQVCLNILFSTFEKHASKV